MGLISWRDLQFRRRRFAIAALATALVFSIAVLLTGVADSFDQEIDRTVGAIGADAWIVPEGANGPFTNSTLFDPTPVLTASGDEAGAVAIARVTVLEPAPTDLLVLGTTNGFAPAATEGHEASAPGEVVVDESFGVAIGDELDLGARTFTVVGTYDGFTLYAGTATASMSLPDVQALAYGGQPLATAVAVRGAPAAVPDGFRAVSTDAAIEDISRVLAEATSTIDLVRALLWLIAVGIVGSIVYLNVLERTRDFAVLKATGVASRSIVAGVMFEAVVLSLTAAVVAVALSLLLRPRVALAISLGPSTFVTLLVVAILAGAAASLVGVRRAVTVDPALAFG